MGSILIGKWDKCPVAIGTKARWQQDPIKKQRRQKTATDWAPLIILLAPTVNGFIVVWPRLFVAEIR
ncbi:MAG: hypothetical protein ABJH75_20305 [Roseibium sp.]|uniref:hypothetical protein n=1 Tax=Roseibium sp. TaxID=1936156 RepID=UPI00329A2A47